MSSAGTRARDRERPTQLPSGAHRPHVGARTERYGSDTRIAAHWHDEDQLVYVSAGLMAIHTVQGAWVASPGRAFLIPAGVEHEHRTYGDTLLHLYSAEQSELFRRQDRSPDVILVDALLHEVLKAATDEALPIRERQHLERVLVDRLRRTSVAGLQLPTARDPRLRAACTLVQEDLGTVLALPDLARAVHTSERTLTRLFKSEFAQTYPQWRTNARLFHAMTRLAEGAAVSRVALECGWASTSAFIDTFRRIIGQTPGEFQASARR